MPAMTACLMVSLLDISMLPGYLGLQPPSEAGSRVSQVGTLVYIGFFLLMP